MKAILGPNGSLRLTIFSTFICLFTYYFINEELDCLEVKIGKQQSFQTEWDQVCFSVTQTERELFIYMSFGGD